MSLKIIVVSFVKAFDIIPRIAIFRNGDFVKNL